MSGKGQQDARRLDRTSDLQSPASDLQNVTPFEYAVTAPSPATSLESAITKTQFLSPLQCAVTRPPRGRGAYDLSSVYARRVASVKQGAASFFTNHQSLFITRFEACGKMP